MPHTQDAFEAAINVRQNKPAEHVAKFIDARLRSGGKGASSGTLSLYVSCCMYVWRAGKSKSRTEGLVGSRTHGLFTSTHSQKSALYFVWQMASALAYNIADVVG